MHTTKGHSGQEPPTELLSKADPGIRHILRRALQGEDIGGSDALQLYEASGANLLALAAAADEMRRRQTGDVATYVVNRNINFTNVCVKRCAFCAFGRSSQDFDAYRLPVEEIVRRVCEGASAGATEVCIQAALPPDLDGKLYIDIAQAVKKAVPEIHLHAFSPEEVYYGARRAGIAISEFLRELKEAGLDTLPGTSAEILDQTVRDRISPGRITVRQWVELVTTAHRLGIRTTATMMYGHIETPLHRVKHMELLRDIQRETGGFTEFVPLAFVYPNTPLYRRGMLPAEGRRDGAMDAIRVHAVARLMLGASFRNVQASWIKEGPEAVQVLLGAGANDVGGTLIEESISSSAGGKHGQFKSAGDLRRLIRGAGRTPAQRSTTYDLLRVFATDCTD
jgi:FO synthase subunit 2